MNEALTPLNVEVPVLMGSMRGFAVTTEFKNKYPQRFEKLSAAFENALARKDVQKHLVSNEIGGVWVGAEKSSAMMKENFEMFNKYKTLIQ